VAALSVHERGVAVSGAEWFDVNVHVPATPVVHESGDLPSDQVPATLTPLRGSPLASVTPTVIRTLKLFDVPLAVVAPPSAATRTDGTAVVVDVVLEVDEVELVLEVELVDVELDEV
jgi:hypothetical protein